LLILAAPQVQRHGCAASTPITSLEAWHDLALPGRIDLLGFRKGFEAVNEEPR